MPDRAKSRIGGKLIGTGKRAQREGSNNNDWARAVPIPTLVFPDPVPCKRLISWDAARERLNALSPDLQTALFARVGDDARSMATDSLGPTDRSSIVLFDACNSGSLSAFVAAADFTRCHKLKPHVWKVPQKNVDPIELALSGRFRLHAELSHRNLLRRSLKGDRCSLKKAS